MSYDIKGYVSVRNNEEKRNGIFSATTLKMPYGATVQIPHMVLDAVEKMEERTQDYFLYKEVRENWL